MSLTHLTIAEALKRLDSKEITSVELTEAHVRAIEGARALNAFIVETPELALEQVRRVVRSLDVSSLTGPESVRLLDVFAELERLGAAGKALVAGRAAETNQWRGGTDRSAADWLANLPSSICR